MSATTLESRPSETTRLWVRPAADAQMPTEVNIPSLYNIIRNRETRIPYFHALALQTIRKSVQVAVTATGQLLGFLAGAQFSKLLSTRISSVLSTELYYMADCANYPSLTNWTDLNAISQGPSLEEITEHLLNIDIETVTYLIATAWCISNLALNRINRALSSRENTQIQQIIQSRNVLPPSDLSTQAAAISRSIEIVMPVVFDASRYAILLNFLLQVAEFSQDLNHWNPTKQKEDFTMSVQFDEIGLQIAPENSPLSMNRLYSLVGTGVALYIVQALCNFRHDLSVRKMKTQSSSDISFCGLNCRQKGNYLAALFFRGINKVLEVLKDILKSVQSLSFGVLFSGVLNAKIVAIFFGGLFAAKICPGSDPVLIDFPLDAVLPTLSLDELINQIMVLPINLLLVAAASAWTVTGLTVFPLLQSCIKAGEESRMRQLIPGGNQENVSICKTSVAQTLNAFFESILPAALNGAFFALTLHNLQHSGPFNTQAKQEQNWSDSEGDFSVDLFIGVYDFLLTILPGEGLISKEDIILIFVGGILLYLIQAWCNFHHDFRNKCRDIQESSNLTPLRSPLLPPPELDGMIIEEIPDIEEEQPASPADSDEYVLEEDSIPEPSELPA